MPPKLGSGGQPRQARGSLPAEAMLAILQVLATPLTYLPAEPELRRFSRACACAPVPPHLRRPLAALERCGLQRPAARLRLECCSVADVGEAEQLRGRLRRDAAARDAAEHEVVLMRLEAAAHHRTQPQVPPAVAPPPLAPPPPSASPAVGTSTMSVLERQRQRSRERLAARNPQLMQWFETQRALLKPARPQVQAPPTPAPSSPALPPPKAVPAPVAPSTGTSVEPNAVERATSPLRRPAWTKRSPSRGMAEDAKSAFGVGFAVLAIGAVLL